MFVKYFNSIENLKVTLTSKVLSQVYQSLKTKDVCNILITGGSQFETNLKLLIEKMRIPLNKKVVFWLTDERILEKRNPKRNDYCVDEFSHNRNGSIAFQKWEIYEPNLELISDYLSSFKIKVDKNLSNGIFDISILTVGNDGHVGSNWPNQSSQLTSHRDFMVHLNLNNHFPNRIGFSISKIREADKTFFYGSGEIKVSILNRMMSGHNGHYYDLPQLGKNIHMYLHI